MKPPISTTDGPGPSHDPASGASRLLTEQDAGAFGRWLDGKLNSEALLIETGEMLRWHVRAALVARDAELAEALAAKSGTAGDPEMYLLAVKVGQEYVDKFHAAEAEVTQLRAALDRAAYIAENLHGMIDRETWRETGGDDGQGHYEGEHRADQLAEELRELRTLAGVVPPEQAPRKTENDVADRTIEPSESALPQRGES